MLNINFLSLIICIIGILLVPLPTEVVIRTSKIKYKIRVMYNPYGITNYDYNPYKPNSTDDTEYRGYNVPTTNVSNNI